MTVGRVHHPALGVPSPTFDALRGATAPDAAPVWDAARAIAGWRLRQHQRVVDALDALQDVPLGRPVHPAPMVASGVGPDDLAAALLALHPELFDALRGPALDQARARWRARLDGGPIPELPLSPGWARRWAATWRPSDPPVDLGALMQSLPFPTQGAFRSLDPRCVEGLILARESGWGDALARRGWTSPRIPPAYLERIPDHRCAAVLDPPGAFVVGPPGSGKRAMVRQLGRLRPDLGINVDNWHAEGPPARGHCEAPVPASVQPGLVCVWTETSRRMCAPALTRYAAALALDPTAGFRLVVAATAEERAAWIGDAPDLARWPVLAVEPPAGDELLALWLCQSPRVQDELGERLDLWQLLARLDPARIRAGLSVLALDARWVADDADLARVVDLLGAVRHPMLAGKAVAVQLRRGAEAAHRWLTGRHPWLDPLVPTPGHLSALCALDAALSGTGPAPAG
ncbi:MAG: hypothetical protein ABMB14_35740 [Myxococcota bacterium]